MVSRSCEIDFIIYSEIKLGKNGESHFVGFDLTNKREAHLRNIKSNVFLGYRIVCNLVSQRNENEKFIYTVDDIVMKQNDDQIEVKIDRGKVKISVLAVVNSDYIERFRSSMFSPYFGPLRLNEQEHFFNYRPYKVVIERDFSDTGNYLFEIVEVPKVAQTASPSVVDQLKESLNSFLNSHMNRGVARESSPNFGSRICMLKDFTEPREGFRNVSKATRNKVIPQRSDSDDVKRCKEAAEKERMALFLEVNSGMGRAFTRTFGVINVINPVVHDGSEPIPGEWYKVVVTYTVPMPNVKTGFFIQRIEEKTICSGCTTKMTKPLIVTACFSIDDLDIRREKQNFFEHRDLGIIIMTEKQYYSLKERMAVELQLKEGDPVGYHWEINELFPIGLLSSLRPDSVDSRKHSSSEAHCSPWPQTNSQTFIIPKETRNGDLISRGLRPEQTYIQGVIACIHEDNAIVFSQLGRVSLLPHFWKLNLCLGDWIKFREVFLTDRGKGDYFVDKNYDIERVSPLMETRIIADHTEILWRFSCNDVYRDIFFLVEVLGKVFIPNEYREIVSRWVQTRGESFEAWIFLGDYGWEISQIVEVHKPQEITVEKAVYDALKEVWSLPEVQIMVRKLKPDILKVLGNYNDNR